MFPAIRSRSDYEGEKFGGHDVTKVLDKDCNIPTNVFSPIRVPAQAGSQIEILHSAVGVFLTFHAL